MAELKDFYKVLDAEPGASLRKMEKKYREKALKYQPYTRTRESFRNKFINVILAWDMVQKVEQRIIETKRSREDLFKEWVENEMGVANDKAIYYCTLNEIEFEKVILKGFNKVVKGVYIFFAVLAGLITLIPIILVLAGQANFKQVFVVSVVGIIPLVLLLRKAFQNEKKYNRKANMDKRMKKFKGKNLVDPNEMANNSDNIFDYNIGQLGEAGDD